MLGDNIDSRTTWFFFFSPVQMPQGVSTCPSTTVGRRQRASSPSRRISRSATCWNSRVFVSLKNRTYLDSNQQSYGSGSGIWCLFDPWIRDPEYVKSQDPDPGSGSGWTTQIIFPRAWKLFFWVKYLNSLMRIWLEKIRSRMEKNRIQDVYPGSATMQMRSIFLHGRVSIRNNFSEMDSLNLQNFIDLCSRIIYFIFVKDTITKLFPPKTALKRTYSSAVVSNHD